MKLPDRQEVESASVIVGNGELGPLLIYGEEHLKRIVATGKAEHLPVLKVPDVDTQQDCQELCTFVNEIKDAQGN